LIKEKVSEWKGGVIPLEEVGGDLFGTTKRLARSSLGSTNKYVILSELIL